MDLGILPGCDDSYALSINDNGLIVGRAYDQIGLRHAVRFDSTGQGNNIHLGNPLYSSDAVSINKDGLIVGQYRERFWNYSVIFDNGNIILLGSGNASSINDNGKIVGNTDDGATFFNWPQQGYTFLGTLGGWYGQPNCINNSNQIVGYANDSRGYYYAVLFDPTGTGNNINLNTLIAPVSGLGLYCAYSINDNGWILCSAYNYGVYEYYLLIPAVTVPTKLKIVSSSKKHITISWDNIADVNGFYLEKSETGTGGWNRIATIIPATNTASVNFTDKKLKKDTTYWYRIHAYNEIGAGAYSEYLECSTK